MLRRILVPLDFSGRARRALDFAVPLAERYGARIILVHVVPPVYAVGVMGFQEYVPIDMGGAVEAGRKRLREVAADLESVGVEAHAVVRQGSPYHVITTVAQRMKADLIVLTTQGHTGLAHALLGSTAERVVRHAPCAVLTVRQR